MAKKNVARNASRTSSTPSTPHKAKAPMSATRTPREAAKSARVSSVHDGKPSEDASKVAKQERTTKTQRSASQPAKASAARATNALVATKRRGRRCTHVHTGAFRALDATKRSAADAGKSLEPHEIIQEEIALLHAEPQLPNNTYFKMGAAVAVSGLFDLGQLGHQPRVAEEVRRYLRGFGIRSLEDVRRLGINGVCLNELEELYAM